MSTTQNIEEETQQLQVSSKIENILEINQEAQEKDEDITEVPYDFADPSEEPEDARDPIEAPTSTYSIPQPSNDAPFIDPTLDSFETEQDFIKLYKTCQNHKFTFDIGKYIYVHPTLMDRGLPLIVINAYQMSADGIDKKIYQEEAVTKFILLLGSLHAMKIDGTWRLKFSVALMTPRGVKPSTTILRNARSRVPRTYRKAVTRLYISYNHELSLLFTKVLKIFSPKFAKKVVTIKLRKHEMSEGIFLRKAIPVTESK